MQTLLPVVSVLTIRKYWTGSVGSMLVPAADSSLTPLHHLLDLHFHVILEAQLGCKASVAVHHSAALVCCIIMLLMSNVVTRF